MSSDLRGLKRFCISLPVVLALAGCGLFGKKEERNRILAPQGDGCYNLLANRFERFFQGRISEAEWTSTFNCVNDQIEFFVQFVKPSEPDGYTEQDIASLTRRFLITTRPVSDHFMDAVFEIKASFAGGDKNRVSPEELRGFLKFSNFLRQETLILLPLVRNQARHPTRETSMALADAMNVFGERVGNYLSKVPASNPFKKETLIPFVRELIRLTGGNENIVERYMDLVMNLKVITAGGEADRIEASAWSTIVREIMTIFGLYSVYADRSKIRFGTDADESEFFLELVQRSERLALRVIRSRGGRISLGEINRVIDSMPATELGREKREALKSTFPKLLGYALRGNEDALTSKSIRAGVGVYESGMRAQVHLRKIFTHLPDRVTVSQFEEAALSYSQGRGEEDRKDVNDLIATAKDFHGLFPEQGRILRFSAEMRAIRTRNHIEKMHWFRTIIRYLFSVYADGPNGSARVENLILLSQHMFAMMDAWKLSHPELTPIDMGKNRFREANLFTPTSNGDRFLSQEEATYYLAFLFSSGGLSKRIYDWVITDKRCPVLGEDDLGTPAVSADCFRKEYFNNVTYFWEEFPSLVQHFTRSPQARESMERSMEIAARRGGISDKLIGRYDMDSFAALPHYVENILDRFDRNSDDRLDKVELLGRAFPVFRTTLAEFSGVNREWLLKCSLSYIIRFGRVPQGTSETVRLLGWCAWKPFWNVTADRVDLYKIVALISDSASGSSLSPVSSEEGNSLPILSPEPAMEAPTQ